MQILRATSRKLKRDHFFEFEQENRQQIHLHKIKKIELTPLKPLKRVSTIKNHLWNVKSTQKIFKKEENKANLFRENKPLLIKLANVQSDFKSIGIKQSPFIDKFYGTSSNWLQRKKQIQKVKKQTESLTTRCDNITKVEAKDIKKRMQSQIKEYLQLRDIIKKMKPLRRFESIKRQRTQSEKKIIMCQPISTDPNVYDINSQQQNQQKQKSNQKNIQIINTNIMKPINRQFSLLSETPKKDPFVEVKRLRQLKKQEQFNWRKTNISKSYKSVKNIRNQSDQLIEKAQMIMNMI